MRSVLVAAAASALLATPAAGQTVPEGRGLERATTCEVHVSVHASDFTLIDELRIFRYGPDADITIEGVESLFGGGLGPEGISLCEALAEKEVPKLCKKNNRRGQVAPFYSGGFSFKKLDVNPFPEEVCSGPTDPRCYDALFMSFRMTTFDASSAFANCADLPGG